VESPGIVRDRRWIFLRERGVPRPFSRGPRAGRGADLVHGVVEEGAGITEPVRAQAVNEVAPLWRTGLINGIRMGDSYVL
jgi:hypothetical protein